MYKTSLGIDIGTYQLKMFLYDGEKCQKIFTLPMSENIIKNDKIKSSEQISESIKKIVCENKIKTKKCRIVLPESLVFVRQTNVPYMTIDNLKQNLPYEFRDFITAEKDKYFYDYIVLDTIKDESGTNKSIDIMAAAVLKSTINEYTQIMKRADLKLEVALPEEFAYRNVICDYELRNFLKKDDNFKLPQKKKLNEYCFIDLGHFATRLFIFVGSKSAATHVISYGGSIIDDAISDLCGVDAKTASEYKRSNYKNVQNREPCRDIYLRIANDVRRAINFYNFNNPESNLNDIYFCGGGAKIKLLKDAITDAVQLNPHSATELFMPKYDNLDEFAISASAVGITLQ